MKTKRKNTDMNEHDNIKRHRSYLQLMNAPPVNTINDLVEIGKTIQFYKNLDTIMLWRITPYLEELNSMIGMTELKETVFLQVIYYLKGFHLRNNNEEYLHTIIMGSPGHGKTEIAKIIGKLYQAMGILSEDGPFKIAYRDDFIAEYLGQTAIKTNKLLKSCLGGVLFVDEVYSLGPGVNDRDSFSKEAIDVLTSFLSEHKNDFCFIGAGYEEDIKKCFLSRNKGLERRFQWIHKIEKYSENELYEILVKMIHDMNWKINFNKEDIVKILKDNNEELFRHAGGDIETFLTKCKIYHAKRVFSLDKEHSFIFTLEDMKQGIELMHLNVIKNENSKPPLGMYT